MDRAGAGENSLGSDITGAQISELKAAKSKIDWDMAKKIESEIRHDVMAHVKTYAAQCPKAAPIIHLGATSTYVTDNGDLILLREGLEAHQESRRGDDPFGDVRQTKRIPRPGRSATFSRRTDNRR